MSMPALHNAPSNLSLASHSPGSYALPDYIKSMKGKIHLTVQYWRMAGDTDGVSAALGNILGHHVHRSGAWHWRRHCDGYPLLCVLLRTGTLPCTTCTRLKGHARRTWVASNSSKAHAAHVFVSLFFKSTRRLKNRCTGPHAPKASMHGKHDSSFVSRLSFGAGASECLFCTVQGPRRKATSFAVAYR